MTDDLPEEPVERVEVEHEDGTVRTLEGPEARAWVAFVGRAISFTEKHGGRAPDVDWEEEDA